jgi:Spy/CpxP family protein refolding chaperone
MRRHSMWIMTISAIVLLAAPLLAQDPAQLAKVPPSVRAGIQTDFMAQKLQLTAEQRTQVEAINIKAANQMQPLLEGSMWTLMREAKKVDEAKDGELRTVLTPQQFDTYAASKDQIKDLLKQKAAANAAANPS